MAAKKSFGNAVKGADKLFSINDSMSDRNSDSVAVVLDELISVKEHPGKSYSYHLAPDVADAVTREAGKRKISKSKLVEIILRQVLIGGVEE